jgi:hypothetical protein
MTESNDDLVAERDRLQGEVARLRVARDTGVPPELLGNGKTAEEIEQIAVDALAWKAVAPRVPPQTAARPVSSGTVNGVSQISRETLKYLTPQQINAVYAENRLSAIGAPAPPPRTNGEHHAT